MRRFFFFLLLQQDVSAENHQNFQWGHTSEDDSNYVDGGGNGNADNGAAASASTASAAATAGTSSGYEADSVLASIMHESMADDGYHNQEPIVDVQETPATAALWSSWSARKCRAAVQPVDYSDDDGGGGMYRKKARYSSSHRPAEAMAARPTDEFNTFSDYVAERMRNLKADKALQLMARRDIEQVLFKYEMKLLERNNSRESQQQQQQKQQHHEPDDTEAATTIRSVTPSSISDLEILQQ